MSEQDKMVMSSDEEDENDPIDQAFAKIISNSKKLILPKTPVATPVATPGPAFSRGFPVLPPLPPLPTLHGSTNARKSPQVHEDPTPTEVCLPLEEKASFKGCNAADATGLEKHLLLADTSSDSSVSGSESCGSSEQYTNRKRFHSTRRRNGKRERAKHSPPLNGYQERKGEKFIPNGGRRSSDSDEDSSLSDSADESKINVFESLRRFDEKTRVSFESSEDSSSDSSSSNEEADSSPVVQRRHASKARRYHSGSSAGGHPSSSRREYSSDRSYHSGSHDSSSDTRIRNTTLRQRLGLTPVKRKNYDQYRFDHKTQRETSIPPNFNPRTPPEEDYPGERHNSSRASSISSNSFHDYYNRHYDGREPELYPRLLNKTPMNTPPEEEPMSPTWLHYVKNPKGLREHCLNNNRMASTQLYRKPELESPARPNLESRIKVLLGNKSSSNEDSPVKSSDPILRPKIPRPLSRPPSPFLNKNSYLYWYKETYLFKKNHKIGTYACADPTVKRKIGIQIKTLCSVQDSPGGRPLTFTPTQRNKRSEPLEKDCETCVPMMELPKKVKDVRPLNGEITKVHVAPETELELCSSLIAPPRDELLTAVELKVIEELKTSLKRYISEDLLENMLQSANKKIKVPDSSGQV